MADLVRLACYPFLPGVRDAVREEGPDLTELLTSPMLEGTRRRGVKRVMGAIAGEPPEPGFATDERGALTDLVSYGFAKMLLTVVRDRHLLRRYCHREAARVAALLKDDVDESLNAASDALQVGLDGPVRSEARQAGVSGGVESHVEQYWRIHFADYIRHAPGDAGWKLVERSLDAGWLTLTRPDAIRLVENAWAKHLETDIGVGLDAPAPEDLVAALHGYVADIQPLLEEARESWSTGDFGPVKRELFPPCITELFAAMVRGEMVPHHGRFAMASFLATIGMTSDDIMQYFREIPNFDPDKSRYQITHVAGEQAVEKYTPPGCSWMQTNGVCPLEKRDGLCFKIKHPLSYYRARIRFQEDDKKEAGKVLATKEMGKTHAKVARERGA